MQRNLSLFLFFLCILFFKAQTNPTPFNLASSDFSFTGFLATDTNYPSSMQGWGTSANNITTAETNAPASDITLTMNTTSSASTSGISAMLDNGFQFLSTGTNPNRRVGEVCLSLNTTNVHTIDVDWLAEDRRAGTNYYSMGLELQYRIGTTGAFTSIAGSTYISSATSQAAAQNFNNIPLPAECENQPIVQLRWIYYQISTSGSSGRDPIRLDDINVHGNICTTVSTFPYSENFDSVTTPYLPQCWLVSDANSDGTKWLTSSSYPNSSPNALSYSYNATKAANDWAITKGFDLIAGETYQISFSYKVNSATYPEKLKVYYGTTQSVAGMTNLVQDFGSINNATYQNFSGAITPSVSGVYYIGFNVYSDANMLGLNIDDISISIPGPCAGTPTGGTASLSPASGAPSSIFTASVTGSSIATGITYQWESAPSSSGPWSDVVGANAATSNITSINTVGTTYYRRKITCTNSGLIDYSTVVSYYTGYCIPSGVISTYYLNKVVTTNGISNINNTTTGSIGGYGDYTAQSASNYNGFATNITLTPNSSTHYYYCWIDWNNDYDFNDANETIFATTTLTSSYAGVINIPTGTPSGSYRMRVALSKTTITSCGNATSGGEYEDYTFNVVPIPACSGTPIGGTANLSPSTGTTSSTFTASVTGDTFATGLTYQWEWAPTSSGPWSDVSGATSATSTITAVNTITTTYYRRKITCTNSGLFDYSTVVSYITDYCKPTVNTANTLYINQFQFVGMLNNCTANTQTGTAAYSNGYQNYTGLTSVIGKQPQNTAINVVAKTNGTTGGSWKAWVDWNNDGDFNDSGEEIYKMISFTTPSVTFGFVTPATALGIYRIRIGTNSSAADFTPCVTGQSSGEFEDYYFEVVYDCPAKVVSINDVNLFDGQRCGPGSVIISATGNAQAFDFKWYDSIYGGTLLGTGNTFVTPSISSTTTFYVSAVTSGGTCETAFRYPVEARIDPNPTVSFVASDPAICGEEKNSVLISATGDKYQDVIYEKFDSGLGIFSNVVAGPYTNSIGYWENRNSPYIPTVPPYEGLSPAFSSGYFGGNYAIINSDINRSTNVLNHLVSSNIDVSGFLNLKLDFDLYHFSIAANDTQGYVNVEYSLDGGVNWNVLTHFYTNAGNPFNWQKYSFNIPGSSFTTTQFKLRFSHFSGAKTGAFYEAITTLDNVRLYGFKTISTPFLWNSATTTLYDTDCSTPIGSALKTTVCVKPSPVELEDASWTLNANATFSNGCPAIGSIAVANDTKTWKQPGLTDWNLGAQWKPANVPDISKCIIVRTPVELSSNTSGIGKNLIIKSGGSLDVKANAILTIKNYIKNEATANDFIIESDGNLLQIDDGAVNSADLTVRRNANLKRLEYNYWGAPVTGQMLKAFSPNTSNNRFMTYNESDDLFYAVANPVTTPFTVGKGYAIRADNTYPSTLPRQVFNGQFVGAINNGVITTPINCTSCTATSNGFNLIGNPYPSNLDFSLLQSSNSGLIYNTYYVWTNNSYNPAMQGSSYPGNGIINNYSVYTALGGLSAPYGFTGLGTNNPVNTNDPSGTPTCPSCMVPNKHIKVGQGFIVKAKTAGTLTFNNSMRSTDASSLFFNKNSNVKEADIDRFWISLQTPLDFVSPILLGYAAGATNNYELDYDAELLSEGSDSFYSLLNTQKLAVQGRYPFTLTDVIPLGANFYTTGTYVIRLDDKDGIFANGQAIYLKDKLLNNTVNLQDGNYTFTTNVTGSVLNRFEILYTTDGALDTDTYTKKELLVYKQGNYFMIESPDVMNVIRVYDASGNLITERKPNSKTTRIETIRFINGVYVIDIDTNTNKHYTKKVIK